MKTWEPIETAPDNVFLLFYCAEYLRYGVGVGLGVHSLFITCDGSIFEPSHWMPLPEPPETVPFKTSEA
jgi:hypothetical protein